VIPLLADFATRCEEIDDETHQQNVHVLDYWHGGSLCLDFPDDHTGRVSNATEEERYG
jgi:hypothetical protein